MSRVADVGLSLDKAAKLARVKAHPDKNLRADMSAGEKQRINDEAARIGQAADILTNPRKVSRSPCCASAYATYTHDTEQRAQYDMELIMG